MPNYLCAVVSKTLIFLTFSLFCQNSSTLSAIIYYLSDICIIQAFNLWKIATFLTGFHVIKISWNYIFDCFWPFRPVLGVSGMAGEKTAHRPPSRLAPSPPSKIKAPCHFSLSPGKNPSLCEIPYQSPKKCLKTQITTFSILKFSPKAKNTPVLTVFTLFLLFVASSHCSAIILLLVSSFRISCLLKIPRGKTHVSQSSSCIFLPIFWPTNSELTHRSQLAAFFTFFSPFSLLFRDSTENCQILRFQEIPCQKSHKNNLFWSFFLGLVRFFKVFFCDNCFELFCSTA